MQKLYSVQSAPDFRVSRTLIDLHFFATGVCSEEYGFDHPDERVCKAMFERTEEKAVANIEHVSQQS